MLEQSCTVDALSCMVLIRCLKAEGISLVLRQKGLGLCCHSGREKHAKSSAHQTPSKKALLNSDMSFGLQQPRLPSFMDDK